MKARDESLAAVPDPAVRALLSHLLAFGMIRALGEGFTLWVVGERDLQRSRAFYERRGAYAVATAGAVGGPVYHSRRSAMLCRDAVIQAGLPPGCGVRGPHLGNPATNPGR